MSGSVITRSENSWPRNDKMAADMAKMAAHRLETSGSIIFDIKRGFSSFQKWKSNSFSCSTQEISRCNTCLECKALHMHLW